jgi:hypothetical protein
MNDVYDPLEPVASAPAQPTSNGFVLTEVGFAPSSIDRGGMRAVAAAWLLA